MGVELSVVLPVYNEAAGLRQTLAALGRCLEATGCEVEILCIDDGSTDGSGALLDAFATEDSRLRVVHFTRNFGKEAALHAGLERARGEAAVFLDADLQHPPELLPLMVELWRAEGYDVVEACKRDRGSDNPVYRLLADLHGRLLSAATGSDMRGASDFVLLSHEALETLRALPERNRFFRGLVHWIGFRSTRVTFDVPARAAGRTRWSPWRLLRYGIDGVVSFTTLPLVLIAAAGLATTLLGSSLGFIALYHWATGVAVSGFTTVILMLSIFSGLILVSLGTLAVYVARLFEEVKARPLYVVRPESKPDAGDAAP